VGNEWGCEAERPIARAPRAGAGALGLPAKSGRPPFRLLTKVSVCVETFTRQATVSALREAPKSRSRLA